MRIDIIGRPPRLPIAEVYVEDTAEELARRIVGGKLRLMPANADFSSDLSVKELEDLYEAKDEIGFTINDLRGEGMIVDVTSLVQEVDVVQ